MSPHDRNPHDRPRPLDAIDLRVAARLRQRRRELQIDPAILDIVIGEAPGTVERFEAGERKIAAAHLFRLGHALNVDIPYFFAEETAEQPANPASVSALEQGEPPHASPRLVAEGQHLAHAFSRLPNAHLRRLVIRLIKSIAARQNDGN